MPSGEYVPLNYNYSYTADTNWDGASGATVTQWNTNVLTQKPTVLTGNITIPVDNYVVTTQPTNFDVSVYGNGNGNGNFGNNYTYTGFADFNKHSEEILAIQKFLGLDKKDEPKDLNFPLDSKKPVKRVHYDYPGDGSRWDDI